MILPAGEEKILLEDFGMFISASVVDRENGWYRALTHIDKESYSKIRGPLFIEPPRGIPQYICYLGPILGLRIFPATDKPTEITVTYYRSEITV